MPIAKVLIANRGEIACRIIATARKLGIATVAVYSDADAHSRHVSLADQAVRIGPPAVTESYLRMDRLLEAAKRTAADAIHPGYGFLSERAEFARAVREAGLVFVGPPPGAIEAMGLKDRAKALMADAGVPIVAGYHGDEQAPSALLAHAEAIGFPVLIKARAGGGGKGMRRVDRAADFPDALASAQREAQASFGDPHCLVEKFISRPRHIEMQVFADMHGHAVHLFERDCSLQRRHQKVLEEAPAPGMTAEVRDAMGQAAVRAAQAVGYVGAGTVEFIVDGSGPLSPRGFWFMEMNTRLQVEHPVTEAVTGVDLVALQFRVAAGEPLPFGQADLSVTGHAVEVRLYAEDPARGFLPTTGTLARLAWPPGHAADGPASTMGGIRIDSGVRAGDPVSPHYDPMIAKLVVHDADREEALRRLSDALAQTAVAGVTTNRRFLQRLVEHPALKAGGFDTGFIAAHPQVAELDEPVAQDWALAALATLDGRDHGARGRPESEVAGPFAQLAHFRHFGPVRRVVRLAGSGDSGVVAEGEGTTLPLGDGPCDVVVETVAGAGTGVRHRAITPAGEVLLIEGASGEGVYVADGVREAAHVTRCQLGDREAVIVQRRDSEVVFYLQSHAPRGADALIGGDQVLAPMTGVVQTVDVAPGDSVTAGQVVAVLAAMKMEHRLLAARDGRIAEVRVAAGEPIARGAVVAVLAAAKPTSEEPSV